jgi:hypothetical protein
LLALSPDERVLSQRVEHLDGGIEYEFRDELMRGGRMWLVSETYDGGSCGFVVAIHPRGCGVEGGEERISSGRTIDGRSLKLISNGDWFERARCGATFELCSRSYMCPCSDTDGGWQSAAKSEDDGL